MRAPINVFTAEAILQTEGLMKALTEVEMPLVHVLQRMEAVGIAVDTEMFEKHKVCPRPIHATADQVHNGIVLQQYMSPHTVTGISRHQPAA